METVMKILTMTVVANFGMAFTLASMSSNLAQNGGGSAATPHGQTRRERLQPKGTVVEESDVADEKPGQANRATEAPTGFDNVTNGFDQQGPDFATIDENNVVPLRSFNDNRFIFEETETVADGL